MDVLSTLNLRRSLAPPFWLRTFLVQTSIDANEVDEVEADGLALLVDSPRDVYAATLVIVRRGIGIIGEIGQVVGRPRAIRSNVSRSACDGI